MAGFFRGSTPIFKLTPTGYSVTELGVPTVTLSQELVFKELEATIDAGNNCVIAKLAYKDSLNFVAGVDAHLQVVWTDESGDAPVVVPFNAHDVKVFENHVEFTFDDDGTVIE